MSSSSKKDSLLIERYKYVLDQKKNLNERTFKIASVYQALLISISVGQFKIVSDTQNGKLGKPLAIDASWGLFVIMSIVSGLMICLILGGVVSWFGYRNDESEIELSLTGVCRMPPRLRDAYKWYESYIVLAGVFAFSFYLVAMIWEIIPAIKS